MTAKLLHLRISKEMQHELEALIGKGRFSNKNEIIREAIRLTLLKYKELKK